jgi:hypothetical protein
MNLKKKIDSPLPPVTHVWTTLVDFFLHIYTFHHKKDTKDEFSEKYLK